MKLYTTTDCAYCPMVKRYLDMKKVQYEVINVDNDTTLRQWLIDTTKMMTVPVLMRDDGEFVVGWNAEKIGKLINGA